MKRKYKQGDLTAAGMSMGIMFGFLLSLILGNNLALIGVGIVLGVAIGVAIEEDAKKKGQIIKLTKLEKKKRYYRILTAFIIGVIVAIIISGLVSY